MNYAHAGKNKPRKFNGDVSKDRLLTKDVNQSQVNLQKLAESPVAPDASNLSDNENQSNDSAESRSCGRRRISVHVLTESSKEISTLPDESENNHEQPIDGENLRLTNTATKDTRRSMKLSKISSKTEGHGCQHTHGLRLRINPDIFFSAKPFTKTELEEALPRKSFFSCHEKALKDAGYETDVSKIDTQSRKYGRTANTARNVTLTETETSHNVEIQSERKLAINSDSDVDISDLGEVQTDSTRAVLDEDIGQLKTIAKEVDYLRLSGHAQQKRWPETVKADLVECRPLVAYLEYVKDNKQEFLEHLKTSRTVTYEEPWSVSLRKMGRAFELRNNGGKMKSHGDDVTVLAAKTLRPRTADFTKFNKQQKKEMFISETTTGKMRSQADEKRPRVKNISMLAAMTAAAKDDELPTTELERRMMKAEDWCKSVPTDTFIRARIQSLRQLGSDDLELTNWSEAFKNCHYIRRTGLR